MKILKRAKNIAIATALLPALVVKSLFVRMDKLEGSFTKKGAWHKLRLDGAVCSDGSTLPAFAKEGQNTKDLIVFFAGGGGFWCQETAARPMSPSVLLLGETAYYLPKVFFFLSGFLGGILSNAPENPFKDWNAFFVPYATGDLHLGSGSYEYISLFGKKKALQHKGRENAKIAAKKCKELFPHATRIFIMGDSAGAFGSVGNAPTIASAYPEAETVLVFADAGQIYSPTWKSILNDIWKADETLVESMDDSGQLMFNLVSWASAQLPNAVFLASNTVADDILTPFQNKMNGGEYEAGEKAARQFRDGLEEAEKLFAESGLPRCSFLTAFNRNPKTGLTQHTLSRSKGLFECKVEGVSLAQWLAEAAEGKYRGLKSEL
ncbi:MAG: pectinacetylesterase family protein [Clostridiales bacterium]|jgi:hypothetical protein|nr:pectinacetylesterase family protein [Clostridiales bacterium]